MLCDTLLMNALMWYIKANKHGNWQWFIKFNIPSNISFWRLTLFKNNPVEYKFRGVPLMKCIPLFSGLFKTVFRHPTKARKVHKNLKQFCDLLNNIWTYFMESVVKSEGSCPYKYTCSLGPTLSAVIARRQKPCCKTAGLLGLGQRQIPQPET